MLGVLSEEDRTALKSTKRAWTRLGSRCLISGCARPQFLDTVRARPRYLGANHTSRVRWYLLAAHKRLQ